MADFDFNSPIWLKKMETAFKQQDQNKNGILSYEEFMSMLIPLKACNPTEDEMELARDLLSKAAIVIGMKPNEPGVNMEQWINGLRKLATDDLAREKNGEQMLFKAGQSAIFNIIDVDKNGTVSIEELSLWLKSEIKVDDDAVKVAFDTIDKNKNGKISREEFVDTIHEFWFSTKIMKLFGSTFDF